MALQASKLWAFFFLLKLTPEYFFSLGVACLDYNFGVLPVVAEKERLSQFLVTTTFPPFYSLTVARSLSLVHVFFLFQATREWFVPAAVS